MDDFPPSQDFPAKEHNRSAEEDLLQPKYGKDLYPYEEGDKLVPIPNYRPPERPRSKGFWIATATAIG